MKFKGWIRNLKIPRLLIEAILVFSSVYFALILEADRSRDFEREMLIGELNALKKSIITDSIIFDDQILNTEHKLNIDRWIKTENEVYTYADDFGKEGIDSIMRSFRRGEIFKYYYLTYLREPITYQFLS